MDARGGILCMREQDQETRSEDRQRIAETKGTYSLVIMSNKAKQTILFRVNNPVSLLPLNQ